MKMEELENCYSCKHHKKNYLFGFEIMLCMYPDNPDINIYGHCSFYEKQDEELKNEIDRWEKASDEDEIRTLL